MKVSSVVELRIPKVDPSKQSQPPIPGSKTFDPKDVAILDDVIIDDVTAPDVIISEALLSSDWLKVLSSCARILLGGVV